MTLLSVNPHWRRGIAFACMLFLAEIPSSIPQIAGLIPETNDPVETVDITEHFFDDASPLELNEATRISLARNLDIRIARLDVESLKHEVPAARAIYDTELSLFGRYAQNHEEKATVVLGQREVFGEAGVSLSKMLPTGTRLTVTAATDRNSTDSPFVTTSRYYQSYLKTSATQPFLKNFFGVNDRRRIRQVRINTRKLHYEALDKIEASLAETRINYWHLVFAYENLRAMERALDRAREFLEITRDQLERGLIEKPDLYAARANVKIRWLESLQAKNDFDKASFLMKTTLNTPEVEVILPDDRPEFIDLPMTFEAALDKALSERRDLKQIDLAIENQEVEIKIKRNENLPDLTFSGSFAGTSLDRELASSQGEVFGVNHPRYEAGFTMTAPIERRAERHRLSQAKIDLEQFKRYREQLLLEIRRQVDGAWKDLLFAREAVIQQNHVQVLQRMKLEEEEKQYYRGRSTSKTIIDYQQDVINAEITHIRALVGYRTALENFYRVQHSLFAWAGVEEYQADGT